MCTMTSRVAPSVQYGNEVALGAIRNVLRGCHVASPCRGRRRGSCCVVHGALTNREDLAMDAFVLADLQEEVLQGSHLS